MATKKFKLYYEKTVDNTRGIYKSETGIPAKTDTCIVTFDDLTTYVDGEETKKYVAVYVRPIAAEDDSFASYEIVGVKADSSETIIVDDVDAEYHACEFVETQADCIDEACDEPNPDYEKPEEEGKGETPVE